VSGSSAVEESVIDPMREERTRRTCAFDYAAGGLVVSVSVSVGSVVRGEPVTWHVGGTALLGSDTVS
jgi:hypothetical protein